HLRRRHLPHANSESRTASRDRTARRIVERPDSPAAGLRAGASPACGASRDSGCPGGTRAPSFLREGRALSCRPLSAVGARNEGYRSERHRGGLNPLRGPSATHAALPHPNASPQARQVLLHSPLGPGALTLPAAEPLAIPLSSFVSAQS